MSTTATATAPQDKNSGIGIKPQLRVLLVEDKAADRDLILRELGKGEFDIISDVVQTAQEFRQRIKTNIPDVILADYNLGQWRGMEALEILRAEGLDIPLILVSGALGRSDCGRMHQTGRHRLCAEGFAGPIVSGLARRLEGQAIPPGT